MSVRLSVLGKDEDYIFCYYFADFLNYHSETDQQTVTESCVRCRSTKAV
jgi:hypothetical protein